jgi:hypothetical protein
MKYLVYRGEYLAGQFTCNDKDRGFRVWCWANKVTHPDNYIVVPAPK